MQNIKELRGLLADPDDLLSRIRRRKGRSPGFVACFANNMPTPSAFQFAGSSKSDSPKYIMCDSASEREPENGLADRAVQSASSSCSPRPPPHPHKRPHPVSNCQSLTLHGSCMGPAPYPKVITESLTPWQPFTFRPSLACFALCLPAMESRAAATALID